MPVVIISIRVRIGNSQALAKEGTWTAWSICPINDSHEIGCRSGQNRRSAGFANSGAVPEYQRGVSTFGHWSSGFKTIVVSTMLSGAGSVAESDLPIFP